MTRFGRSLLRALRSRWRAHLEARRDRAVTLSEEIDVVYTWVDGADPDFQREFRKYRALEQDGNDPHVAGNRRFRNSDELRYSLRSIETHAPWTSRVFLISNGQIPGWLRRDHPRLRLVTHRDIFPDPGQLPTFNSLAIEAHLHRIPGLSRRYLYLNDDWFLGRTVYPGDFISHSGLPKVRFTPWPLPGNTDEGELWRRWSAWNRQLLRDALGDQCFRIVPHAPILYDRAQVEEVVAQWSGEFDRTSAARFRRSRMAMMQLLYSHAVAARKLAHPVVEPPTNCQLVNFGPPLDDIRTQLAWVKRRRPKFFAINDDWDEAPDIKDSIVRRFLEDYFPRPSSFEELPSGG